MNDETKKPDEIDQAILDADAGNASASTGAAPAGGTDAQADTSAASDTRASAAGDAGNAGSNPATSDASSTDSSKANDAVPLADGGAAEQGSDGHVSGLLAEFEAKLEGLEHWAAMEARTTLKRLREMI